MRRLPASVLALGLVGAALVGCAPAADVGCSAPASSDRSALDLVTVDGEPGEKPELTAYTPIHAETTTWERVAEGDGPALSTAAQDVVLEITLYSGTTGEEVGSTAYDGSLGAVYPLEQWTQTMPALVDALMCAQAGSRTVTVLAPDGFAEGAASSFGLDDDDSAVAVVDVRKVYLAKADGADQFVDARGLPVVVRAPDGRPGIIIPDSEPPEELEVVVLKRGTGAEVTGDAPVRVAYTGLTWAEREVFETTWGSAPTALELDAIVPGLAAALEGQTVGSQVLAVIPPSEAYGEEGSGSIPGDATLVFVVDILGIDE